MRDPARIKRICRLLEKVWSEPSYQDMRLGQVQLNYIFGHESRVWFQEDDLSETALKLKVAELKRGDDFGLRNKKRSKRRSK